MIASDYEMLLENSPEATIMINAEGQIRYINLQAERLFLWNRAELIGERLEKLIPERYRGVHLTHRANYAKAPRLRIMGMHIRHLAGLRKDGREFPAEISLSPLPEGYVLASVRERLQHDAVSWRKVLPIALFILVVVQAFTGVLLYTMLR